MALTRPVVAVRDIHDPTSELSELPMPTVMSCTIRPDLVRFAHKNVSCNRRQPYAVSRNSGYQTSAESWGTGRAVARIPRVAGGGTHRAGQGAFGNMCRGGGMFAPTKIWRRWHRQTNLTMRRHAIASAIAASAIPALVMARGHRIDDVPEIPLVVSNKLEEVARTRHAVELLGKIGAKCEMTKVKDSKTIRKGRGKSRNRRYTMRKGPLVVYARDFGLVRATRNIPGVETCDVSKLSLLSLAPGGVLGRFVIWTEEAFRRLQDIYGDYETGSKTKKGYVLPRGLMTNCDLQRIINSDEIQRVLNPLKAKETVPKRKRNPLKDPAMRAKLDPTFDPVSKKRKIGAEAETPAPKSQRKA
eukprot:Polyplicarium_translucidae@DN2954_c0_g1_i1.p3